MNSNRRKIPHEKKGGKRSQAYSLEKGPRHQSLMQQVTQDVGAFREGDRWKSSWAKVSQNSLRQWDNDKEAGRAPRSAAQKVKC